MQSLLVILIVITGIILPTQVKGEREDYILLISSYNSNSSWTKTLEASFRQELKKNDCPYPVYSEYLNTDLFASPEIWIQSTRFILNNHRLHPPKMVILIADAAWMAYRYTCLLYTSVRCSSISETYSSIQAFRYFSDFILITSSPRIP